MSCIRDSVARAEPFSSGFMSRCYNVQGEFSYTETFSRLEELTSHRDTAVCSTDAPMNFTDTCTGRGFYPKTHV